MHTFRTLCILDVLFYIVYSARYSLFVLMCRKTHITHSLVLRIAYWLNKTIFTILIPVFFVVFFFHCLFGQVNISCGQEENEVQLVHGQKEKIQNSTPLLSKGHLSVFVKIADYLSFKTNWPISIKF